MHSCSTELSGYILVQLIFSLTISLLLNIRNCFCIFVNKHLVIKSSNVSKTECCYVKPLANVKTNISTDFQIRISVPLKKSKSGNNNQNYRKNRIDFNKKIIRRINLNNKSNIKKLWRCNFLVSFKIIYQTFWKIILLKKIYFHVVSRLVILIVNR